MTTMQESNTPITVADDGEIIDGQHRVNTLHVMDHTGDSRFMWDVTKAEETKAAEKQFKELKKKGYLAYTTDEKGERGQVIREFDPNAGAIIMVPQLVGG